MQLPRPRWRPANPSAVSISFPNPIPISISTSVLVPVAFALAISVLVTATGTVKMTITEGKILPGYRGSAPWPATTPPSAVTAPAPAAELGTRRRRTQRKSRATRMIVAMARLLAGAMKLVERRWAHVVLQTSVQWRWRQRLAGVATVVVRVMMLMMASLGCHGDLPRLGWPLSVQMASWRLVMVWRQRRKVMRSEHQVAMKLGSGPGRWI